MDGIINIYKEKGFTSHDVVAKMRGILHTKKIGHTGTLDPDAVGVLPVCIGKGTRLCSLFENHDKTYKAVMLLGKETDTQDISGKVLNEKPVLVSEEMLMNAVEKFRGPIMQIPPMYSALKVNGKKLYEYAREGITIERKARPVEIYELTIEKIDFPRVTMTISCSKGTYIRTLCNDIGNELGCGACMESLERTRVGQFYASDAITLSELIKYRDDNMLDRCIKSIESFFADIDAIYVKPYEDKLVRNGNRIIFDEYRDGNILINIKSGFKLRVYDSDGNFVGVYEYDLNGCDFKPFKMFL